MPTSPLNAASYSADPKLRASVWLGDPRPRTPERVRPSLRITFSSASALYGNTMLLDASPVGDATTLTANVPGVAVASTSRSKSR